MSLLPAPKPAPITSRIRSVAAACARDLSTKIGSAAAIAGIGVAACAACCAAPLVLAAVGLGSTAAGLGVLSTMLEPALIGAVGLAIVAVSSAVVLGRRARRAKSAVCATDGACGCATIPPTKASIHSSGPASPDAPIMCTARLDSPDVQAWMSRYRAAFARLIGRELLAGGGFRWRFRAEPGLESELTELATRERECCQFFRFDLSRDGDEIVWETHSDARASAVLEEYFLLPDRLAAETRAGHDVAALRHAVERAGLKFLHG